eukprot:Gregarina_sp_Poly_1__1508@NODE_137_length_13137_cov_148_628156_g122_i0_p8_GENE_NODE_137_length_13137_cov_148_628156_g122_i0NODE_137_length_13137_cov_148_628156_g122_i0_p8_ORF_typecomplete_len111_score21_03dsDNA_bind/PF01984_20/3_3e17Fer4_12/PF13353_6/0_12_NODE_137_length_13137_cov_148_628156_g122_i01128911621
MRNDAAVRNDAEAEIRKAEQDEQRRMLLKALMQQDAFERLKRIELVRPDKARQIQEYLIQNQVRWSGGEKLSEAQLVTIISQIDETQSKGVVVKINRRRASESDDELWKN